MTGIFSGFCVIVPKPNIAGREKDFQFHQPFDVVRRFAGTITGRNYQYAVNFVSRIPMASRSSVARARRDCRGDSDRDQSWNMHRIGTIRNDVLLAIHPDAGCSIQCVDDIVRDGTLGPS